MERRDVVLLLTSLVALACAAVAGLRPSSRPPTSSSFGGFDGLREKLLVLGDEGERLWTKLTYGYLDVENCFRVTGHGSMHARIAFDGAPIDCAAWKVMACDDRVGYLEVLSRDARGQVVVNPQTGTLQRERRYGHVRVTFERPA